MSRIRRTALCLAVAGAVFVGGCATGPTTKEEVCQEFDELGTQLLQGNGIFGNPLFTKAGVLSNVADRYEERDLSADAAALDRIADADSTSGYELMNATRGIADLCGHQLGLGRFGNR